MLSNLQNDIYKMVVSFLRTPSEAILSSIVDNAFVAIVHEEHKMIEKLKCLQFENFVKPCITDLIGDYFSRRLIFQPFWRCVEHLSQNGQIVAFEDLPGCEYINELFDISFTQHKELMKTGKISWVKPSG